MPTRREFLTVAGTAAAGVAVGCRSGTSGAAAAPNATPGALASNRLGAIGVGLFTLPKSLEQDFDETLGMPARLGYREVEF